MAKRRYTTEHVEAGLTALALHAGRPTAASEALAAQGIDIPDSTLVTWRDHTYADRYREIQDQRAPQIEEQIVRGLRDTAIQAARVEHEAIALELQRVQGGNVKDAAASARNMATVRGIATDKLLQLTGRPTQVVEHRNADELLRKLGSALPGLIVEGTATEIKGDLTPPSSSALSTDAEQ